MRQGLEWRRLQGGALQRMQLPERLQVQQAGEPNDVVLAELELPPEQRQHVARHALLHLQAHRGADAPSRQLVLQRLEQVLGTVVVDLEVGVADHAEDVVLDDPHPGEEPLQVVGDHVFERERRVGLRAEEPAEQRWDLDSGEVTSARRRRPRR